jgi:hypothetical protein
MDKRYLMVDGEEVITTEQIGKITRNENQLWFHVRGTTHAYRKSYTSVQLARDALFALVGEASPTAVVSKVVDEKNVGKPMAGPRKLADIKPKENEPALKE